MDYFHQILEGAAKTVQTPDDQRITLAENFQAGVQFRSILVLAGRFFLEHLFATHRRQGIQLEFLVLILSGNSGVANAH
jgi:hypothetical protein